MSKTPAEQAGIKLELGKNKIENLIKLASIKQKKNHRLSGNTSLIFWQDNYWKDNDNQINKTNYWKNTCKKETICIKKW